MTVLTFVETTNISHSKENAVIYQNATLMIPKNREEMKLSLPLFGVAKEAIAVKRPKLLAHLFTYNFSFSRSHGKNTTCVSDHNMAYGSVSIIIVL